MMKSEKDTIHTTMKDALAKAKEEFSKACYLEDCGSNAGIRKMNANKAQWLKWVIYLAELGLEAEKLLAEEDNTIETVSAAESTCSKCASKDKLLEEFKTLNSSLLEQLTLAVERNKELKETYDLEVEYRKELARKASIDWCAEAIKHAHDVCWLDGTVLVTPTDYLDRYLLELVKE